LASREGTDMPLNPRLVKFKKYVSGYVATYNQTWVSNPHTKKEEALAEIEQILQEEANEREAAYNSRINAGLEMLQEHGR